jgi:hypothetical protein
VLLFTEGCQVVSSAPLVTLSAAMWCRITELAHFVLRSQKLLKCPPAMSSPLAIGDRLHVAVGLHRPV